MLGTKNSLFVDRVAYPFKGKWKDPKQDLDRNIYYFINEQTLVEAYENGRGQVKPQITITLFGEFPIIANDEIVLETGEKYKVQETPMLNYYESNILVRDLLKPRVESMTLTLR